MPKIILDFLQLSQIHKFLPLLLFFLLASCSPAYILFVQNNTDLPIEFHVEFNTNKYQSLLSKRSLIKYRAIQNSSELSANQKKNFYENNKISSEPYTKISDYSYKFTLEPKAIANVEPNNSLTVYPFNNIYYFVNGEKCSIIKSNRSENCKMKVDREPKLTEIFTIIK